jgi:hypothetical protein
MTADRLSVHVEQALRACGAFVLHATCPKVGPVKLTFEMADGMRAGILVYEFAAVLGDRQDSRSGQSLRRSRSSGARTMISLEQDPAGLYVTLLVSIDPKTGIFVGADPVLHSPMRRGLEIPYAREHAATILARGWDVWERDPDDEDDFGPIEILVGFTKEQFLRYVFFERDALGEDAGHRHLVAERCFARPGI